MVTLDTQFRALGTMTSANAASQRSAVQDLSDRVSSRALARGATINQTYGGNIPAVALTVTPAALDDLSTSPEVARIDPDTEFAPIDADTTALIGAADAQDRGFHGAGAASGVAIMDTGVDYGHPSFGGRVGWASCFSGASDCPNGSTSQIGGTAGISVHVRTR